MSSYCGLGIPFFDKCQLHRVWILIVCLTLSLSTGEAAAQTLTGRLVETGTSEPVRGARVSLYTPDSVRRATTFSDSIGNFALPSVAYGRHQLKIERLGSSSVVIEVHLDSEQTRKTFELRVEPIDLGRIEAVGVRSCSEHKLSVEGAILWNDVRKAFETVTDAGQLPRVAYIGVEFTRNLDRWKKIHATDSATVQMVGDRGPYLSLPVDSLLRNGFIQPDPTTGAFAYYGPDAEVLMSPEFLTQYCFAETTNAKRPGEIGLKFRDLRNDTIPGIIGTIWADRRTHELSSVEFKWDRLPVDDSEIDAGGVIEFSRLPNGPWIVTRWVLTAPRFVEQMLPDGKGVELFFATYRQFERYVVEARYEDGRIAFRRNPRQ